jgi:hypothetical protein
VTDDIVTRLRAIPCNAFARVRIEDAAAEIERLRAERDEARAEVTFLRPSVCLGAQTASEYAKTRGWDCFKEDG